MNAHVEVVRHVAGLSDWGSELYDTFDDAARTGLVFE